MKNENGKSCVHRCDCRSIVCFSREDVHAVAVAVVPYLGNPLDEGGKRLVGGRCEMRVGSEGYRCRMSAL